MMIKGRDVMKAKGRNMMMVKSRNIMMVKGLRRKDGHRPNHNDAQRPKT